MKLWRLPESPNPVNHHARDGTPKNDSRGVVSDRVCKSRGSRSCSGVVEVLLFRSDQKRRVGDECGLGGDPRSKPVREAKVR